MSSALTVVYVVVLLSVVVVMMYFIVFPFLAACIGGLHILACHQSHARFARAAYRGFRRRLPISFFFHVKYWLNHLRAFHRPPCSLFLRSVLRLYSAGGGVVSRAMSAAPPAAPAWSARCSCPPAPAVLRDIFAHCHMGGKSHIFAVAVCSIFHKLFLLSSPISHTIPTSASHQRSLPKAPLFLQRGSRSRQKNNEAIAHGLVFPLSDNLNCLLPSIFICINRTKTLDKSCAIWYNRSIRNTDILLTERSLESMGDIVRIDFTRSTILPLAAL